jgi:hypothetical protein
LIQCEHEFNATKIVEKEKYNNPWYNREAYCQEVINLTAYYFFGLEEFNLQSFIPVSNAGSNNEEHQGVNSLQSAGNDSTSDTNGNKTSFPQVKIRSNVEGPLLVNH